MTPEQRLVRYAEAMGWPKSDDGNGPVPPGFDLEPPYYFVNPNGSVRVCRKHEVEDDEVWRFWELWNPLTDANDALKLAEKMDIAYARTYGGSFHAAAPGSKKSIQADTLPAAICAAADAMLEKPENGER